MIMLEKPVLYIQWNYIRCWYLLQNHMFVIKKVYYRKKNSILLHQAARTRPRMQSARCGVKLKDAFVKIIYTHA